MCLGTKPANYKSKLDLALTSIPDSTFWDIVLWLFRQRQRFQVVGTSMLPSLKHGDEILADLSSYRHSAPAIGDVVVVKLPKQPDMNLVKRVLSVHHSGACFVQGDNRSQSTDSWDFGWVEPHFIVGRVTSRFL